jgi:hypothetical protein
MTPEVAVSSPRERWNELPPARRGLVVAVGVLDAALRAWALADLRNRPAEEVHGPKSLWALALTVVSSAGLLPGAYLVLGRRHRGVFPID